MIAKGKTVKVEIAILGLYFSTTKFVFLAH
jgi:hypothetical protein